MTDTIRANPMRKELADAANGAAATGFIAGTLSGWTVQEWAAAAALLYTLLLIADKAWSLWQKWRAR